MNSICNVPEIGMGATVRYWSDCKPYTIVRISKTGLKIRLQEDKSYRIDNNGMSDVQEYTYQPDSNGGHVTAFRRRDGNYYLAGSKKSITLGVRRKFHDYCF